MQRSLRPTLFTWCSQSPLKYGLRLRQYRVLLHHVWRTPLLTAHPESRGRRVPRCNVQHNSRFGEPSPLKLACFGDELSRESIAGKALIHSVKIDTVEVAASVATAMGILKPGST